MQERIGQRTHPHSRASHLTPNQRLWREASRLGANNESSNTVHLTLWHGVNPPRNRDVLQKLVDRFNQTHPQIQVELLYVGQGDQQMPKILSAVVGNAPPNRFWYAPMITGQLVELNAIQPLEDWLERSPVKDEVDPALRERNQHGILLPLGKGEWTVFTWLPFMWSAAAADWWRKTYRTPQLKSSLAIQGRSLPCNSGKT